MATEKSDSDMKIPFSIYDFFGYLASGFLLLAAVDFAFDGGWLLKQKFEALGVLALFWLTLGFIIGHILANIAGFVLEKTFVRGVLRSPEEMLFCKHKRTTFWAKLFPGFYEPLPQKTQERILKKAMEKAGIDTGGRALFFHCHAIVKREPATLERLNTFLNAYGFCRNVSMAALTAAGILFIGGIWLKITGRGTVHPQKLWWAVFAVFIAIGMLYRYLKFFRHYTVEVFITYAETP